MPEPHGAVLVPGGLCGCRSESAQLGIVGAADEVLIRIIDLGLHPAHHLRSSTLNDSRRRA